MITSQIQKLNSTKLSSLLPKPTILSYENTSLPIHKQHSFPTRHTNFSIRASSGNASWGTSIATKSTETSVEVKAIVTVKVTVGGIFSNIGLTQPLDELTDVFGKTFLLELVSSELDPSKYISYIIS